MADWSVTLGRTDTDVWDVFAAVNMFNDPPAAGWRYVMAPVTVRYLGAGYATPWLDVDVELLGGDGRVYTPWGNGCGVAPRPVYDIDDMYTGASAGFDNCVAIPASAIAGARWRGSGSTTAPARGPTSPVRPPASCGCR